MRLRNLAVVLPLLVGTLATVHAETWTYQGQPVYYRKDGSGPSVLQVHGIGAGASLLTNKWQIPTLVRAGYTVYSVDLLGWGQSIGPQQLFTGQIYVDLLKAFIQEVVPGPVAIHGQSLGGTYSVAAAAALPDRVTTLVLNAPVGLQTNNQAPTEASIQAFENFVSTERGQNAYALLGSWPSISLFCKTTLYVDPTECTAPLIQDSYQYTQIPDSIYSAASFVTANLGYDITEALIQLKAPALVIYGAENKLTPLSEALAYSAANPLVRLEVIPGASSFVNDEKREEYDASMLRQFESVRPK